MRCGEFMKRNGSVRTVFLVCCALVVVMVNGQAPRRQRITFGDTSAKTVCSVRMEGTRRNSRRPPIIEATVQCGGETLFDEQIVITDIEETTLDNGMQLFTETPFGGMAYVYLDEDSDVNLVESSFLNLPEITSGGMAAPVVVMDINLDITNTTFDGSSPGFRSGAVIVGGSANVDFLNVSFFGNMGEEGAVHITGSARTDLDFCHFRDNNGTEVGALKLSDECIARVSECLFEFNAAEGMANEIYITDTAMGFIDESSIFGDESQPEFEAFLRDGSRPDNEENDFNLPFGGVAAVTGKATGLFTDCLISGHIGRLGAIYIVGSPVFSALQTDFVGNRAVTGGGLYVNADRAGFARVLECNFTDNLARNGGGLVFAGNGTYTLDECHFENNQALSGGAVWGDYSESNTCPRASAGSRVTILASTFVNNTAQRSGGAFFIQCTDIFAENSVFANNVAMNGDGGFIYAGNTFDLRFADCNITGNRASGSGGAFYVNRSNDIVAERCLVTDNTAEEDGGTIVSLNGNGIIFTDSVLHRSISGRHGGAIFASNLQTVDFDNTSILLNNADGRGGIFSGTNVTRFLLRNLTAEMNNGSMSGAIDIQGGDVFELADVELMDNHALSEDGGAIRLVDVQNITIDNVTFFSNSAQDGCGALSAAGSQNLIVQDSSVETNTGTGSGGFCLDGAGRVAFTTVEFVSNLASSGAGGAVRVANGRSVELVGVTFSENEARTGDGGAVVLVNVQNVTIDDTSFLENLASGSCGALSVDGTTRFEIQRSIVDSNLGNSGGGFCMSDVEAAAFTAVEFFSNVARSGNGGAFEFRTGGSLSMSNLTLILNNASQSGGAFLLSDLASATILDTTLGNSTAMGSGGCFSANSVRMLALTDSTFANCTARDGGGAVFTGTTDVSGFGVLFDLNIARRGGGAFLCRERTSIEFDESRFFFNGAPDGSTLNADCDCQVDIRNSRVHRDENRPNNGGFFKINRACSAVMAFGNEFFGEPESNSGLEWYEWTGVGIGAAVAALLCLFLCNCVRRRRAGAAAKKEAIEDLEKQSEEEEEELSEEEEETEYEDEDEEGSEELEETEDDEEASETEEQDERRRRR